MAFYFDEFPIIEYNAQKLGVTLQGNDFQSDILQYIRNPIIRYKLADTIKNYTAVYYPYTIREGESAQFIAKRYYGNVTLDWVLYFINEKYDPLFDWPLNYFSFEKVLRQKYGSIPKAKQQIRHYEIQLRPRKEFGDGTFLEEEWVIVDQKTFLSHTPIEQRREVTQYDWELRKNEEKREIKIMKKDYIAGFQKAISLVL